MQVPCPLTLSCSVSVHIQLHIRHIKVPEEYRDASVKNHHYPNNTLLLAILAAAALRTKAEQAAAGQHCQK